LDFTLSSDLIVGFQKAKLSVSPTLRARETTLNQKQKGLGGWILPSVKFYPRAEF
jgi:hypothetical protein